MSLEKLRRDVWKANLNLVKEGLVIQTWGNASGIDRSRGLIVIKPSGVSYDLLKPEHMVVVSVHTGHVVQGKLRPSSDTLTHLELYRAFKQIGGIVHSHNIPATVPAHRMARLLAQRNVARSHSNIQLKSIMQNTYLWMTLLLAGVFLLGCVSAPQHPAQISREPFGQTKEGTPVDLFTLRNKKGVEARISNYGGLLVSFKSPDRNGKMADVVLGFDHL